MVTAGDPTNSAPEQATAVASPPWDLPDARPDGEERDLLMLGGGLAVAATSLAIIILIAYQAFFTHTVSENSGIFFLGLAFFPYTGGIFLFWYAWEFGDVGKALWLTLVVAAVSVVALAVFAFMLTTISRSKGGAARTLSAGNGSADLGTGPYIVGSRLGFGGPVGLVLGALGASGTQRNAPPKELRPEITCMGCGSHYTPVPPKATCPNCGRDGITLNLTEAARAVPPQARPTEEPDHSGSQATEAQGTHRCASCGAAIDPSAKFCSACGSSLLRAG